MARHFTIHFDDGTKVKGIEYDEPVNQSDFELKVLRYVEQNDRTRMRLKVEEAIKLANNNKLADKYVATEAMAAIINNKDFVAALAELIDTNFHDGRNGGFIVSSLTQAKNFLRRFGFGPA